MKKNNLYLLIVCTLVFAFSLTMMFILNDSNPILGENASVLYYITKVVSLMAFVSIVAYVIFARKEVSAMIIALASTTALQFYPLLLRFWLINSAGIAWPIAITFIVFIAYFSLIFMTDIFRAKAAIVQEKLVGKEIKVKNESEYFDENGKFIGKKGGK